MSKLKFTQSVSLDGFSAGPNQNLDHPLGEGGRDLHEWAFATRTFQEMWGREVTGDNPDDRHAARWNENVGAVIMGRNMFGPVRGNWEYGDDAWNGWWGDDPPYHSDVFVLTHHPRDPVEMAGGTTFYFVTDGPEAALERARASAAGQDVSIGGGAATIRQFLQRGLVDEMAIHVVPKLLGGGERLLEGVDPARLAEFECVELVASPVVAHYLYVKTG